MSRNSTVAQMSTIRIKAMNLIGSASASYDPLRPESKSTIGGIHSPLRYAVQGLTKA